jgi:pSer/pThr/pTyr-binding forkhead associated (FHA) protein
MTCPKCGSTVAPNSNFCPHCGERLREHTGDTTGLLKMPAAEMLEDLSEEQIRAVEALPQGSALLIAVRGQDRGARYLLDSDTVVAGRSPESDIFLDDITVSRQHCVFQRGDGQLTVTDQGSLNGTYVNRTLTDGPVVLRAGDEVQIGKFRLVFYPSPHGLG